MPISPNPNLFTALEGLRQENQQLVTVVEAAISNQSKVTPQFTENKARLADGILLNLNHLPKVPIKFLGKDCEPELLFEKAS